MASEILSNIKALDEKINQKEQELLEYKQRKERELSTLKAKRDKIKAAYFSNLMDENHLTFEDMESLFEAAKKEE
jgi:hypothetical protein